jgi:hypothetical protein
VRVVKKGFREGDRATMSLVELVEKNPEKTHRRTGRDHKVDWQEDNWKHDNP